MPEAGFHFEQPIWLLALLLPVGVHIWLRLTTPHHDSERYRGYADVHLLPFLLGIREASKSSYLKKFLRWTMVWTLLVFAMAGPRWDYTDIQLFRPGNDLLILLDLSQSMNTPDIMPTRLQRARQEIDDILNSGLNARIGLVAFSTLAHVMSPLTEDTHSLHTLLPALNSDLTRLKGSRLTEALIRAQQLFAGQPEESGKHILLISDGDFGDQEYETLLQQLAQSNIRIHVLGMGTSEGGQVRTESGRTLRMPGGGEIVSRLDETGLRTIAQVGNGIYLQASLDDDDTSAIMKVVNQHTAAAKATEQKTRVWNDRYYWLILIAMLSILPGYRLIRISFATSDGGGR